MSQLDLEQLELEGEEHLAENLPAPGKATLTSRIGKPQRAGAGDLIDGDTHAQLAGGLGVELSRGDGGGGGGAGTPRKPGAAVGFLSGGRSDLAADATADHVENRAAGKGLDYLAQGNTNLRAQQRAVTQFDSAGDFYDQRATVEVESGEREDEDADEEKAHQPIRPGAIPKAPPRPNLPNVGASVDLESQQRAVVQFDSAGDFYDQRATVDPTIPKAPPAPDVALTPAAPTPLPIPYPSTSAPAAGGAAADLTSQQRAVVQFDSVGDFYDQRATVDPTIPKAPPTPDVALTPAAPTPLPIPYPNTSAPAAGGTAADLTSQQREVVQFDSVGDFYDQRATVEVPPSPATAAAGVPATAPSPATAAAGVPATESTAPSPAIAAAGVPVADPAADEAKSAAQTEAAKAHEAMHAAAGTAGGAIDAAQAAGVAAQQKANAGADAAGPDVVGMINPDLKKPGQPSGDVPLDMINPDLKKTPGKPGDVPLDAINPDLKKQTPPAKPGDVPLDAINPDLKKKNPAEVAPGKAGDVPLDAINPDLKRKTPADGLLNPYDEDEPLLDGSEFDAIPGDELKDPAAADAKHKTADPGLDAKVEQAKANPQESKELLKAAQQDVAAKKQGVTQGIEAKTAAAHKASAKGAAGAVAKGGKKVSTVAGKGAAAADKAKTAGDEKKIEKAKNIDELKKRVEDTYKTELDKLNAKIKEQKTELDTKIKAEEKKIDDEMAAQAKKLVDEIAKKNKDVDKKIADKKKVFDKQIVDETKKAEQTFKTEQQKTKTTTQKEVAKVQKQGDSEAQKVIANGRAAAQKKRSSGGQQANAAVAAAEKRAQGATDDAAKNQARQAGQAAAQRARNAANAEASALENAAKEEAAKRKELTKQLVADVKAKGEAALTALDAKHKESVAAIKKKADDGLKQMDDERKKAVGEVQELEKKLKAENEKKNKDAKLEIHKQRVAADEKIKQAETNGPKELNDKRESMLRKLSQGTAAELEALEKETNEAIGKIQKSVADTTGGINAAIADAQKKAQYHADQRVKAIQTDGQKQLTELDTKLKNVEAKIAEIDKLTQAGIKKAGDDAKAALEKQGEDDRNAIKAKADQATVDLAKTSEQYAADKAAEEKAAAEKKAAEEKAKADAEAAEKQRIEDEAKKKQEAEEAKKKAFEEKTKGAADELFKAMDGWGTDEKAIMNALKGKTPEEMKAIKEAYLKKTGRNLDADLADEMSGTDLKEAKALMSGDPVQGAVAQLQSAMEGWGTDEEKVKATLAGITDPEMRKKVIQEYEKQTGERLQKVLEDEGMASEGVKTDEFARPAEENGMPMRELTEDEKQKGFAAVSELEGAMHRWGTDEAKLFAALKGKSPEELAFIKEQYKKKHGKDLDTVLEDELSGTDLKEARALMTADPVQAAVAQMHNAADGIGTDDEKILATLKEIKDPQIRKKVAEEYEKQTGENLNAMIADEMSGMDKDLADALVGDAETGDVNQGKVAAIEADKAMHGGFLTDISDGMADTLGVKREDMRGAVGSALFGPVLGKEIGTDVGGTDEEALYKAMESVPADKRQQFLDEYKARTGRDLKADLKKELTGKEQDVTDAILSGDTVAAEAAKMAAAADGIGTDRKALYASLEGKTKEEREAIIAKFNEKYGKDWPTKKDPKTGKDLSPFEAMCEDELDDLDRKKAQQIAEAGKMDDGFALYYAMNEGFLGIGTDDAALKEKLKGKSKEEIAQLQKDYLKAKYEAEGKDPSVIKDMKPDDPALKALNNDVAGETSGRTGHELKQSLKGNPTTPEEMLQRAKEDYEFERKDSGWIGEVGMAVLLGPAYLHAKAVGIDPSDISNGITDMWSDSGKQLDKDYAELVKQYNEAKQKHENDPKYAGMTPEERKKAIDAAVMGDLKSSGAQAYVEGSIKQFGEAKDTTADAVGTAVAIAVGAVITIASGGTAAPALVALISGLAGVSAKMIIKGASMSNEELVQELAQVAAEALAAGIVKLPKVDAVIGKLAGKFGNGLAAKIVKEALEEAVESGLEEVINALLDEDLYKGDLADFATKFGGRVGKAALTGAGAAVVSTGFGEFMPKMKEMGQWEVRGIPHGKALSGAINQAVGAAFTTAIDPNTYQGGGGDVAMAFGKSMGSAALRGLRDGYSTGEGFESGKGWKTGPTTTQSSSSSGNTSTAQTTTTATSAADGGGDAHVTAETDVKVTKGDSTVKVEATATGTVQSPKGTATTTDTTTKVLPIDGQNDNKTDTDRKNDAKNDAKNDNAADPTQETDADKKNEGDQKGTTTDTSTDGKVDPSVDNKQAPKDKAELRAFVAAKYAAIVSKYQGVEHSADPRYGDLISELKQYAPGELGKPENKAAAKAILDKWMALSEQISKETGKSEAELRELYNMVEKQDMPVWLEQIKGLSPKQQAEALHMFRTELKVMIRDLMTDTNSKEVLYLRDLAVYGDRTGPKFDDLMAKAMKKNGGDENAAYQSIIDSAQRSNADVNKGITGNESGIKTDGDKKNEGGDTKQASPQQTSKDIDQLYKDAAVADVELKALTLGIAGETGGEPMFPPGLKGKDRAMEKIAADYGGDASRIMDLSRASIVFDNMDGLQKALASIEGKAEIVRGKNRFDKPTASGYRDITLNIKMANGHIVELQLHLKQIMEVKQGEGHKIYEQTRAIEAKAQLEGRDLTADEKAQIAALEAESRKLYDAALDSATKKAATDKSNDEIETQETHKDDEGITAAAIPGSTFHGKNEATPQPGRNADLGTDQVKAQAAKFGLTFKEQLSAGRGKHAVLVFTDAEGNDVKIRVESMPLEGSEVAFTIVNPTKDAHVIQISDRASKDHIERAIAHELAEIQAIRARNKAGDPTRLDTDALTKGKGQEGTTLSPHDMGRLAELEVLAKQLNEATTDEKKAEIRREIHALIEFLGLRAGTRGTASRMELVLDKGGLTDAAKKVLAELRARKNSLPAEDKAALEGVRKQAAEDARREADQKKYERPMIGTVTRPNDGRTDAQLAKDAADARQKKSDEVLADLRKKVAEAAAKTPSEMVKISNPQIGGGAAVSALSPGQYFIDNRGRWQKDASGKIAQTKHQLGDIKDAGIGDPAQFKTDEDQRVSLDAINFMQDTLAAQANCINGTATIALDAEGRMIMTIRPQGPDGKPTAEEIHVEIEGTPTIATGFAPDNIPRGDQSMADNRAALETALTALKNAGSPNAEAALAKLKNTPTQSDAGFASLLDGLTPGELDSLKNSTDPAIKAAVAAVNATKKFLDVKANPDNDGKVFLGQEANITEILMKDPEKFKSVKHWVIAGTGGTGISAAEIILKNNPAAKVTMVGRNVTAGLADNDQFKRVMKDHGPTGDGRFEVITGQEVDTIKDGTKPGEFGAGGQVSSKAAVKADTDVSTIDPKTSTSWMLDANNPNLAEAVVKILAENKDPKLKITIIGALPSPDVKAKLKSVFEKHGVTGSKKLELVTTAGTIVDNPAGGFMTTGNVEGDGFIGSVGFRGNCSPPVQALIDQATREDWPTKGELLFDKDDQYIGYRVTVTTPNGDRSIEVTGAASRSLPTLLANQLDPDDPAGERTLQDRITQIIGDRDAPAESGGFDGGYSSSATQAAKFAQDKRQRAEDAENAANYVLQGSHKTITLPPDNEAAWEGIVKDFFADELDVHPDRINVKRLGGGKSGASLFKISLGEADLGVFKLFSKVADAKTEMAMMRIMASKAMQKYQIVDNKTDGAIRGPKGGKNQQGGMLMETASGRSIAKQIENLPTDPTERAAAINQMIADVKVIAEAFAEFHQAMATGELMTPEAKKKASDYVLDDKVKPHAENRVPYGKDPATTPPKMDFTPDGPAIIAALEALIVKFKAAPIPATAYHGDANVGNFMVDGDKVNVIDVGTMTHSLNKKGEGQDTGAADLARFVRSMETLFPGQLTSDEVAQLTAAFENHYFAVTGLNPADLEAAKKMYQVEVEITAFRGGMYTAEQARDRIKAILGI